MIKCARGSLESTKLNLFEFIDLGKILSAGYMYKTTLTRLKRRSSRPGRAAKRPSRPGDGSARPSRRSARGSGVAPHLPPPRSPALSRSRLPGHRRSAPAWPSARSFPPIQVLELTSLLPSCGTATHNTFFHGLPALLELQTQQLLFVLEQAAVLRQVPRNKPP